MIDIYSESQRLLELAGYRTKRDLERGWLIFEDETLIGFINVLEMPEDILRTWESSLDFFLAKNAMSLRSSPAKAWNIYSIYLSSKGCTPVLRPQLLSIEENFRGSRKIVQAGITSSESLFSALAPLLPIKNLVKLKEVDSGPLLLSRLSFLKPSELHALERKGASDAVIDIILETE